MNDSTDILAEQLSAYMDGELPEAEARFLQRRLENDAQLRARWGRMHVAASCLKGQPWRPMPASLPDAVTAGLAAAAEDRPQDTVRPVRRPLLRWAMAASVAALAIIAAPQLLQPEAAPTVASGPALPSPTGATASPSAADLVAVRPGQAPRAPAAPADTAAAEDRLLAVQPAATGAESPLPLTEQSPTEFPLVDNGGERSWPRSQLVGIGSQPALEAYLVRHNQMLAGDGLGGFVPYVDVVANELAPATAPASGEEGAEGQ